MSRFIIRRSFPGKGNGLFATLPIQERDFILEYTGRHVDSKAAEEMTTKYLFEIDDQWTIDGSARSNTARYINHACDPNCEAEIEDGKIMIYATMHIGPGEELTMDYGEEYFDEFIKPHGCRCEACVGISAVDG